MIELVTTSGIFALDGAEFAVENNVWIVGDDREVLVIDAAHDHLPIANAVGDRVTVAIVATHGHNDHINAAGELADLLQAPIWIHPHDLMLWREIYPDRDPSGELADGMWLHAGGVSLQVLHTPGHTPGGCCLHDGAGEVVFSGDTLFRGGPGATGRAYSDFATIISSISERLLVLPATTAVRPGHGASTTIGAEAPHLLEWVRDHG